MIIIKKQEINFYFNKFVQGILLTFFIIFIFIFLNYKTLLNQFLFYEIIPYYKIIFNKENISEFMCDKEDICGIDKKNKVSSFNPEKIEDKVVFNSEDKIFGLEDIIYQSEDEFSNITDNSYKEKFNYDDMDKYKNVENLINTFYVMDKGVGIIDEKFDIEKFLNTDLKIKKDILNPKVLIIHTHAASEFFSDSDSNDLYEGVVGAGRELSRILEEKYGIKSIHYPGVHDKINGKINRSGAYERIEPVAKKILDENPSIELVLDIHRDGIASNSKAKLSTEINGKKVAKIMFVNGVSTLNDNGIIKKLDYLPNPNIETNLALSFNMQLAANELYPDFTRKLYLKPYRYTNHLLPRSLLIELGSQYTTKEEAWNSMEIIANLLDEVIFY